ncbi:Hsp70 family protein [bacterium]|nr:Hsp70 family protein [bacterium]
MFIGIDLGTTNSAITSFDGKETRIWKSPEQNDVTPSVIYINKRGGKVYGQSAYNNEPRDPNNTAKLFKRLMGTNTKIHFDYNNLEMTPEECSAEILRTLFSYLPEDIRNDENTATVITVPAAFNQMQKDATKQAAYSAGINKVALIQEPVAAIMSIAKLKKINGLFVVYDFGGGTFDVSIAERTGNNVNLLTNDGIAFCGGRDFDKMLFENIVIEWLYNNFNLPEDFRTNKKYASLLRMAIWATEKAKIELSAKETASVRLDENEINCTDEDGKEIYLDVNISRDEYNNLIFPKIDETIEKTREVIKNASLKPDDISYIVFVGGPSNYKPLRDRVSTELGIETSFDVNPMTVVSEGAAIYAESIDFTNEKGGQKASKGVIKSTDYNIEFRYNARTSAEKAKVAIIYDSETPLQFSFKNIETGWTSGKLEQKSHSIVELDLFSQGDNTFVVECTNEQGKEIKLDNNKIIITKTLVNIGNIPAAHSVGVELEDPITHKPVLDYLITKDEILPKSGTVRYKTTKRISAGSDDFISFKLWEGEIAEPIEYNRFIGDIKIDGNAFEYGIIPVGSVIECNYTFNDSGNIDIKISIPSVGIVLNGDNFYNRLSGQIDYSTDSDEIVEEASGILEKINDINKNNFDEKLSNIQSKLDNYMEKDNLDAEDTQSLFELTQESKSALASYMKKNQPVMWQKELDEQVEVFETIKEKATPAEQKQFENLRNSIQSAINAKNAQAEVLLKELHKIIAKIMLNDDDVFVLIFASMVQNPQDFTDRALYNQLIAKGHIAIQNNDINELRNIVSRLAQIMIRRKGSELDAMLNKSGITK